MSADERRGEDARPRETDLGSEKLNDAPDLRTQVDVPVYSGADDLEAIITRCSDAREGLVADKR